MVVVGFDRPTIERAMELVEKYDFLYASVGWHPVDAIDMKDEDLLWIEELASHPKPSYQRKAIFKDKKI